MSITNLSVKLLMPVLQQDVVQVLRQSESVGNELVKSFLFWFNILLGASFLVLLIVIVTANDQGEGKNKKVGNWLYYLGFAAVGLFIIRKAFFNM